MLIDATLAASHYLPIILLVVFLAAEAVSYKPGEVIRARGYGA